MTRRISSIALVLIAGGISFWAYSLGEAGPLVAFGHGDANRGAVKAWQQIPLHVAISFGFAVAGPNLPRVLAGILASLGLVLLGIWVLLLTFVAVTSLADFSDPLDVLISTTLLSLYTGGLILSWPIFVRPFDSARPSTNSRRPQ